MAALLFAIYVVSALAARSAKEVGACCPCPVFLGSHKMGNCHKMGLGEYRRSFADATCPGPSSLSSLGPPMDEA